ncbi:MAG TPA: FtsX-like permease family protein [Burkholderiales bacterium]|nr:FtsX-like permease family protein [Burkholderiales bacterium]
MALIAIAAGVCCLVLAGGFVEDIFFQLAEALIRSQSGHVQIAQKGFFVNGQRAPLEYLMQARSEFNEVKARPEVAQVGQRLSFSALMGNGRSDIGVIAEGIEPDKEQTIGGQLFISAGRAITTQDRYGVMVGEGLAAALGLTPDSNVSLLATTASGAMNSLDFRVVGVFRSFSKEFDARAARLLLPDAQELLGTDGVSVIVVLLKQTSDTEQVATQLGRDLGRRLEVKTWAELNDFYIKTVALYRRQLSILRVIILVMVSLGVVNIVNITVLERLPEYGTMRALGSRSSDVLRLVITENCLIGLVGSVVGCLLGLLLGSLLSSIGIPMPAPPNSEFEYVARVRTDWSVLISAAAAGFIATLVACIPPAIRSAATPIGDALRRSL